MALRESWSSGEIADENWTHDDYIKYYMFELSRIVDEMALTNFSETCMVLDGELTNEIHLKVVEDRNQAMTNCMALIKKIKDVFDNKDEEASNNYDKENV